MEVLSIRRRSRPSFVQAERLEVRQILGAPLALTGEGLVLASPATDELLEPAVFAAAAPEAEPLPALAPEDDPLSPVGDPKGGESDTSVASTSCCSPPITYMVSILAVQSVSEATPEDPGAFQFYAEASCSAGAASSITVGIRKPNSTATPWIDYEGEIAGNSVTISLDQFGRGTKNASFIAINEDLDEAPLETVNVEVIEEGVIKRHPTFWFAQGTVASGDYTVTHRNVPPDDGEVSAGEEAGPLRLNIVEITVTQNGQPQEGVSVTVRHASNDDGADVRVVSQGEDVYEASKQTDRNGKAFFTFVGYAAPEGGGNVKYDIHYVDGEGRPKRVPNSQITIRVVPYEP